MITSQDVIEGGRLCLSGLLTIYEVSDTKERLLANPAAVLDLSGLTQCDGTGLQLLLLAHRDLGMRLVAPSKPVAEVLQLTGLSHLIGDGA
jgi:anti-sigma B factor antagonist